MLSADLAPRLDLGTKVLLRVCTRRFVPRELGREQVSITSFHQAAGHF